jgi:cell division FtsZ-interacting protein ZapD
MLDMIALKNMTTRKMLELIDILEKEVKFRTDIGKEIEEEQKNVQTDATVLQEYMENKEERLAAFIKWRSSFAADEIATKKEIKTRNYLEGSDKPFE